MTMVSSTALPLIVRMSSGPPVRYPVSMCFACSPSPFPSKSATSLSRSRGVAGLSAAISAEQHVADIDRCAVHERDDLVRGAAVEVDLPTVWNATSYHATRDGTAVAVCVCVAIAALLVLLWNDFARPPQPFNAVLHASLFVFLQRARGVYARSARKREVVDAAVGPGVFDEDNVSPPVLLIAKVTHPGLHARARCGSSSLGHSSPYEPPRRRSMSEAVAYAGVRAESLSRPELFRIAPSGGHADAREVSDTHHVG